MSAEATGWVYRHSPYRGAALHVHLAIADTVSDQNDNLLWMRQARVAAKARVGRQAVNEAIARMVADGLLELVEANDRAGKASVYRFLMPAVATVYESRGVSPQTTPGVAVDDRGVSPGTTGGVAVDDTEPKENPRGTQLQPRESDGASDRPAPPTDAGLVCYHLQQRITSFNTNGSVPRISRQWVRDADLLLRLGGAGETPHPLSWESVVRLIDYVFDHLAEPERAGSTFCWAKNVQSPGSLRRGWVRILNDARMHREQSRSPVERAMARRASGSGRSGVGFRGVIETREAG